MATALHDNGTIRKAHSELHLLIQLVLARTSQAHSKSMIREFSYLVYLGLLRVIYTYI
jgi:hypothetical protein